MSLNEENQHEVNREISIIEISIRYDTTFVYFNSIIENWNIQEFQQNIGYIFIILQLIIKSRGIFLPFYDVQTNAPTPVFNDLCALVLGTDLSKGENVFHFVSSTLSLMYVFFFYKGMDITNYSYGKKMIRPPNFDFLFATLDKNMDDGGDNNLVRIVLATMKNILDFMKGDDSTECFKYIKLTTRQRERVRNAFLPYVERYLIVAINFISRNFTPVLTYALDLFVSCFSYNNMRDDPDDYFKFADNDSTFKVPKDWLLVHCIGTKIHSRLFCIYVETADQEIKTRVLVSILYYLSSKEDSWVQDQMFIFYEKVVSIVTNFAESLKSDENPLNLFHISKIFMKLIYAIKLNCIIRVSESATFFKILKEKTVYYMKNFGNLPHKDVEYYAQACNILLKLWGSVAEYINGFRLTINTKEIHGMIADILQSYYTDFITGCNKFIENDNINITDKVWYLYNDTNLDFCSFITSQFNESVSSMLMFNDNFADHLLLVGNYLKVMSLLLVSRCNIHQIPPNYVNQMSQIYKTVLGYIEKTTPLMDQIYSFCMSSRNPMCLKGLSLLEKNLVHFSSNIKQHIKYIINDHYYKSVVESILSATEKDSSEILHLIINRFLIDINVMKDVPSVYEILLYIFNTTEEDHDSVVKILVDFLKQNELINTVLSRKYVISFTKMEDDYSELFQKKYEILNKIYARLLNGDTQWRIFLSYLDRLFQDKGKTEVLFLELLGIIKGVKDYNVRFYIITWIVDRSEEINQCISSNLEDFDTMNAILKFWISVLDLEKVIPSYSAIELKLVKFSLNIVQLSTMSKCNILYIFRIIRLAIKNKDINDIMQFFQDQTLSKLIDIYASLLNNLSDDVIVNEKQISEEVFNSCTVVLSIKPDLIDSMLERIIPLINNTILNGNSYTENTVKQCLNFCHAFLTLATEYQYMNVYYVFQETFKRIFDYVLAFGTLLDISSRIIYLMMLHNSDFTNNLFDAVSKIMGAEVGEYLRRLVISAGEDIGTFKDHFRDLVDNVRGIPFQISEIELIVSDS